MTFKLIIVQNSFKLIHNLRIFRFSMVGIGYPFNEICGTMHLNCERHSYINLSVSKSGNPNRSKHTFISEWEEEKVKSMAVDALYNDVVHIEFLNLFHMPPQSTYSL